MQFDMIRLVLVSRAQTSLFEGLDGSGARLSREDWLRSTFGREIVFFHRGNQYHYVPQANDLGGLLSGLVGRQIQTTENEPPEHKFRETVRSPWRAAIILLDPSHHEDGQKIAFEVKQNIGRPLSVIRSLCKTINALYESPYVIEASSILDPRTFGALSVLTEGKSYRLHSS